MEFAPSWYRVTLLTTVGLLYGLLLTEFGLGAANGGEGTMLPLCVFGSPLFLPFFIFAPIAFWLIIGMLLGLIGVRSYRKVFLALMVLHYLSILPYVMVFGNWRQTYYILVRSPGFITLAFGVYLVGQIAIWGYFTESRRATAPATNL